MSLRLIDLTTFYAAIQEWGQEEIILTKRSTLYKSKL